MLLLEIIKNLKEKRNDFKVLVVGNGNLLPKMKAKANKLGLNENILFLGNIENPEEIYKISDITINCSIKEGLALTSYESLSMGVPVVSSDVGGQKELINEDERKELFLVAKGLKTDIVKEILHSYGFENSNEITKKEFKNICNTIEKTKEMYSDKVGV